MALGERVSACVPFHLHWNCIDEFGFHTGKCPLHADALHVRDFGICRAHLGEAEVETEAEAEMCGLGRSEPSLSHLAA